MCAASPAFAEQRAIVERAGGDAHYFHNLNNESPIPAGANFGKHKRDAMGDIVRRGDDLSQSFPADW